MSRERIDPPLPRISSPGDLMVGAVSTGNPVILPVGAPGQRLSSVTGASGPSVAWAASSEVGPTGSTGPIGPTGVGGPTGVTGAGVTGPIGVIGPTGAASTVAGPTGPTGATGAASVVVGPTGPGGGATGPQGIQGVTGPTGPTGAVGAASTVTGPTGPLGLTGPAGVASTTGPTGPTGARGATGTDGGLGPTGPTGPSAIPRQIAFISEVGGVFWSGQPSAVTLIPYGNVAAIYADLRTVTQFRLTASLSDAGAAGAKLRIVNNALADIAATAGAGDLAINTAGSLLLGGWATLGAAYQVESQLLKVVGLGGDSFISPTIVAVRMEVR